MNYKQNEKSQSSKRINFGSRNRYRKYNTVRQGHLTGEALSLEKSFRSATAEKDLNLSKHGCSIYRTSIRSWMQS